MRKLLAALVVTLAFVVPELAHAYPCPTGYTYTSAWEPISNSSQTTFQSSTASVLHANSGTYEHIVYSVTVWGYNSQRYIELGVKHGWASGPNGPFYTQPTAFVRAVWENGGVYEADYWTVPAWQAIQLKLERQPGTNYFRGYLDGQLVVEMDLITREWWTAFGEDYSSDTVCDEYDTLHVTNVAHDFMSIDSPWQGCWNTTDHKNFQGWGPWMGGTPVWGCASYFGASGEGDVRPAPFDLAKALKREVPRP